MSQYDYEKQMADFTAQRGLNQLKLKRQLIAKQQRAQGQNQGPTIKHRAVDITKNMK